MIHGFVGVWLLLILWCSLLLCYYAVRRKNYIRLLPALPAAGVSYYFLQIVCETGGEQEPIGWIVFICLLCTLLIAFGIYSEKRWQRTHLSEMTVKYAVDALPTGICCYDASGRVLLKNKAMEDVHWKLTGKALLNGVSFAQLIDTSVNQAAEQADSQSAEAADLQKVQFMEAGENIVVIFPDQKVYEFAKEELGDRKANARKEYVLTASEITEEYQKTQMLLAKQQLVTNLNQKLGEYNKEILSVMTAKEVLNAKVKIHDELGASLLRVKKYLNETQTDETPEGRSRKEWERQAILDSLRQNVTFLQREPNVGEVDEYSLLLKTAEQLDVRIEITGMLPKEARIRNICVTALHECLTNTLRHAQGNLLGVIFREDEDSIQAIFTNNGVVPAGEIVEKGGLRFLRNLVEQEGGSMDIRTEDGFRLTITLGKRGGEYGL